MPLACAARLISTFLIQYPLPDAIDGPLQFGRGVGALRGVPDQGAAGGVLLPAALRAAAAQQAVRDHPDVAELGGHAEVAAAQLVADDDAAAEAGAERDADDVAVALAGTEPTCTEVSETEYDCALAKAPSDEVSNWKGTVEPTVDAQGKVNGGCRSLTADGQSWDCYLGLAAVEQQIVSAGFLGAYAPTPGRG